jgi:hypothetical protein
VLLLDQPPNQRLHVRDQLRTAPYRASVCVASCTL